MNDIIQLLPDSVANQIAAGEVVQRPASVIKELIENSIDAGAHRVQIILEEAGRDLIQVIDDGQGMSPTDARMAFEKHATSKIREANDLFALHTMGFRGEALASIAAVAEVELRTRRADRDTGILLQIAGSRVVKQEAVVCPVGANFMVRNLFYNIPARRKFLKSNQTELSNIMTEVQRVALANPGIEFVVSHNGLTTLSLPSGSLKQRIVSLFGKSQSEQLLPVSMDNDLLSVSGFVCAPEFARKKGALQYFFVNDRYMRHPYFHKAVMECYQDLISAEAQPNYFLFLKVSPDSIDVNIHPTKTEIKFENEATRWHILMATVREALGRFTAVPTIDFDMADAPEIGSAIPATADVQYNEPKPQFDSSFNPFRHTSPSHWETLYTGLESALQPEPSNEPSLSFEPESQSMTELTSAIDLLDQDTSSPDPSQVKSSASTQSASHKSRPYLQVAGRYIVGAARGGLLVVDQHRAHIIILYARYMRQISQHQGATQHELFPDVVDIAPDDEPLLQQIMPDLNCLGFELDNLGGGSWSVAGKPASLDARVDVNALLHQMIDIARQEVHGVGEELHSNLALRLAETEAIAYGKQLQPDEVSNLMEQLLAIPENQFTPNGHPVSAVISADALAKLL